MTTTVYESEVPSPDDPVGPEPGGRRDDDLPAWLISAARAIPRLSRDEERVLGERVAAGDRGAADQLVEANLRLVFKVAARFRWTGVAFDDLVQEGMLGLIHAARGFHSNGARFSTYAVACVEGMIRRFLAARARVVRLPHYLEERLGQLRRTASRLEQTHGRPATDAEVVEALGWSAARVEAARAAEIAAQLVNLDAPLGGGAEGLDLASLLVDEGIAPDEVAEQREVQACVGAVLAKLAAREATVLWLRYGLGGAGPMTMAEAVARLGCSGQRVQQVEQRALGRLRTALSAPRPTDRSPARTR